MLKYFFAAGMKYSARKDISCSCRISLTTAKRHSQAFGFGKVLWRQHDFEIDIDDNGKAMRLH